MMYKVTYKIIYCDYRCSARSFIHCLECGKYFEDAEESRNMTVTELVNFINDANCHILRVEKIPNITMFTEATKPGFITVTI